MFPNLQHFVEPRTSTQLMFSLSQKFLRLCILTHQLLNPTTQLQHYITNDYTYIITTQDNSYKMTVLYCHYGKYQLEITLVHETKKENVTYTRERGTYVRHPYYKLTYGRSFSHFWKCFVGLFCFAAIVFSA